MASADGRPWHGGLRATLYGPADQSFPAIHCGDQIHALIAMHLPERYLDPGVWDATAWLRQQGIGVVGSLKVSGAYCHAKDAGTAALPAGFIPCSRPAASG